MIKVKKIDEHSCRGCFNDGFPHSVCRDMNELMNVDCGKDKIIFVLRGEFLNDEPIGTETKELLFGANGV